MVAFPEVKAISYNEFVFRKGEEVFIVRYKPTAKYEKLTRMKLMEWVDNPEINFTLLDAGYISRAMMFDKRKSPRDLARKL